MTRWLKFSFAAFLVAIAFGVYWDSLRNPLFFDDENMFERGRIFMLFLEGFSFSPRWLPYFMMAWTELIFEDAIFFQRSISLGFHVLTAFVLYAFVKQVSNHVAPHRNNERAALAVALLFVLHPLAVYAVGYLIQRTILMATLFGLLALSTYFDGLVTRNKTYFFFSALFYLLSVFSKEHAILVPAAALALTPLAAPLKRHTWRQLWLPVSLYAAIAILVVIRYRGGVLGEVYEPLAAPLVEQHLPIQSPGQIWGLSVLTQTALFFKYMGLMLIPNPGWMSIDMRVPIAVSLWEPRYVLGLCAFLVYGVMAVWLLMQRGRRGLVGFALLAPLLLFAVEFATVRIQEPFVLYRSYLWMAPVFLVVPALSNALPGKIFWPLILAVALAFAYASNDRLKSFSDGYMLWDDAVRKLPDERVLGSARAHSNRGAWNVRRGALQEAVNDFTRALNVDPNYKDAYQNRAWAFMKLGDHEAALHDANTMIRLYPQDPRAYTLRGTIYRSRGDLELAIVDYAHACQQKWTGACLVLEMTRQQQAATRPAQ